jgi:pimeloyl-ACP methyl ester carboxylesterase
MSFAVNALDGGRVYFEDDGGPGAPVAILGGFLDPVGLVRRAPVARALHELPEEFRLVFVDHRGHGRSEAPHDPARYAMRLRVADVVAAIDACGIDRAHVLGISWGGRLCFGIGEHAPNRVRSLVTIGQHPYAIDPRGPLAAVVGEALAASQADGIASLVDAFEAIAGRYPDEVRSVYLASDGGAMWAAWRCAMTEGAVSRNLASWTVPSLVCVAADDVDFYEQARRAADEIPNAEFLSIEETDHLGMDTARADPVMPAILRRLRTSQ